MAELTPADHIALVNAIATREGNAKQIALWYGTTVDELRSFVEEHRGEIEQAKLEIEASSKDSESPNEVTPTELGELWIGNKFARLQRYERIADKLYKEAMEHGIGADSTVLRELRSYMVAAANELGQLLHRGSGETGTDSLSVDIQGVDMENLR
jgi:hypothetical protein